jgi:hypothetical protein
MTKAQFERTLRGLLRREPFRPFDVEMLDGKRFTVDRAEAVAMGTGAAGFIAEDQDIRFFDWESTRRFGESGNGVSG